MTSSVARELSRRPYLLAAGFALLMLAVLLARPHSASAAACTQPATDYGNVSGLSVSAPATTTYRIWSRMAAPDATNNTYLLEIDGSTCYTVGGSTVPTYANGATTYFNNDTTNWMSKTSSGTQIDVSLTAGTHTFKLIGNGAGVVVDRIILTQDTTCVPTGTGDNCANPPDTTAPVVSITSPANNATISSVTSVTANATDDVAVSKVEFYVDGVLKATDTTSPYAYSFDPSTFSIGAHALTAKAYDTSNNTATSSVVNVTTTDTIAPSGVAITAPTSGATVSGTVNVTATATDNVAVTKVEYYVDGTLKATVTTGTSPYTTSIDTTSLTNASHALTAKAYDAANNSTTSAAVNVTVSNSGGADATPPTVSITNLTASSVLSTDVNATNYKSNALVISSTASDASGVQQVVVKIDGVTKATLTNAPYDATVDVTGLSCGSHTVTATATDKSATPNSATATVTLKAARGADINADCIVNFLDLSSLASKYNQSGASLGRSDVNVDGTVNFLDLSILASKYGT